MSIFYHAFYGCYCQIAFLLAILLRIDTGAWGVIGVALCISCSIPHSLISYTPYERSIFLLLNYIKHVNIN